MAEKPILTIPGGELETLRAGLSKHLLPDGALTTTPGASHSTTVAKGAVADLVQQHPELAAKLAEIKKALDGVVKEDKLFRG